MKRIAISVYCISLLLFLGACRTSWTGLKTPAPLPFQAGEETHYALKVGEQVMGYSMYRVDEQPRCIGKDVLSLSGHTLIKLAIGGQEQTWDYRSITCVNPEMEPRYYKLDAEVGLIKSEIEATWRRGQVHLVANQQGQQSEKALELSEKSYILDGNVFVHYVLLFRGEPLSLGERRTLSFVTPQAMAVLKLELQVAASLQEVAVGGNSYRCYEVQLRGDKMPTVTCWVTTRRQLVKLAEPSQNLTVELSDATVIGRVRSVSLFAFHENKRTPSNVRFSFFGSVTAMRARLEVQLVAEKPDAEFLIYPGQVFTGTVSGDLIQGLVERRIVRYEGQGAPSLPMSADPDLQEYLVPSIGIESDDPDIIAKAKEITAGYADAWKSAVALADWTYHNISYELTAASAKQCLVAGRGDCLPHARLTIAFCRALGIPARLVGGFMYSNGEFGQHFWAEVHLGPAGWIPLDPTMGQYGYLDATHVRLMREGGIASIKVEVLEYTEEDGIAGLERRLPNLAVGNKGLYRFLVNGIEVGYQSYEVVAQELYAERPAYRLAAHLELDLSRAGGQGEPLTLNAVLYVDTAANPLHYLIEAVVGGKPQRVECAFGPEKVRESVTMAEGNTEKEIPLPPGTLLLGNNMPSWFALMYRVLILKPGAKLSVPAYFAEQFLPLTVTLQVEEKMVEVVQGEKTYTCYKVQIPQFHMVDYVTADGLLVRSTVPPSKAVLDLINDR